MHFIERSPAVALILLVLVTASRAQAIQPDAQATDANAGGKEEQKLPPPLDAITCDLGNLTEHFKVVESSITAKANSPQGIGWWLKRPSPGRWRPGVQ